MLSLTDLPIDILRLILDLSENSHSLSQSHMYILEVEVLPKLRKYIYAKISLKNMLRIINKQALAEKCAYCRTCIC